MHRLILTTMILAGCTFPPLPPLDPDAESNPDAQGGDGGTIDASEIDGPLAVDGAVDAPPGAWSALSPLVQNLTDPLILAA